MKKSMRITLPAIALMLAACGGDEATDEVRAWYSPWFVNAGDDEDPASTVDEYGVEPIDRDQLPSTVVASPSEEGPQPALGDMVAPEPAVGAGPADARRVTITVKRGESIKMYSEWSGVSEDELRMVSGHSGKYLKAGQRLVLELTPKRYRQFEDARAEHYLAKEKKFFERYEVEHLVEYTVKKGDSIWKIAKSHDGLPIWVLERFNSNLNLRRLRPGTEMLIPVLNEIADKGTKAGAALFERAPIKPRARRAAAPAADEPVRGLTIRAARGENFALYRKWSGLRIRDLRKANPSIARGELKVGQRVVIPISEKRVTDFVRKRRRHLGLAGAERHVEPDRKPIARAAKRPAVKMKKYRVKRGDTAWKVAVKKYGISIDALRDANPGLDLGRLRVGDVLSIPKK